MSTTRSTLLLCLLGLGLSLAQPYYHHHAHHDSLEEALTILELRQARDELRAARLELAQQKKLAAELGPKEPPTPPSSSRPQHTPLDRAGQNGCTGCWVIPALTLFGTLAALTQGASSTTTRCSRGRCFLFTGFAVLTGLALFTMLPLLLPLLLTFGPLLLPFYLMSSHTWCPSQSSACHRRDTKSDESLPAPPLSHGDKGHGVATLQHVLIRLGHMQPSAIRYCSGFFGPRTHDALRTLQNQLGLPVTGRYDQAIKTHLEAELSPSPPSDSQVPPAQTTQANAPESTSSPDHTETTAEAHEGAGSKAVQPSEESLISAQRARTLADLVEMGFEEPSAKLALSEAQGEMKLAVRLLVNAERK